MSAREANENAPKKLIVKSRQQPSSIAHAKTAKKSALPRVDHRLRRPAPRDGSDDADYAALRACVCPKQPIEEEEQECCRHTQFPLPCPLPCAKPPCKPAHECPPPFVIQQCPALPKGVAKVDKLCFTDPCNRALCKWCISQDGSCGKALVFQADGCDKALLDCDGNLSLLGKLESTALCVAPDVNFPDNRWCFSQDTESGSLQLVFGDANDCDDENGEENLYPITFTRCGVVVQSVSQVDVTGEQECFELEKLTATVMVFNAAEDANKKIKLPDGEVNGQCVTVVNVDDAAVDVCHASFAEPKTVPGEGSQKFMWIAAANKWMCV